MANGKSVLSQLETLVSNFNQGREAVSKAVKGTKRLIDRSRRVVNDRVTVQLGNLNDEVTVKVTANGYEQVLSADDFREVLAWAAEQGF